MLENARKEGLKLLQSKSIAPLVNSIEELSLKFPDMRCSYECKDGIRIDFDDTIEESSFDFFTELALKLKPWRKGPFYLGDLFIDSEWKSFLKWNLIAPHINIKDKDVADVGCNNGYYMFEMAKLKPSSIVGFDPSGLYKCQFDFINFFLAQNICYELLGIEHLRMYDKKFDVIFCLGVLYHRSDPINALKSLYAGLKKNGELILDTLVIDSDLEIALCPKISYAKMPNVYFIPSIKALEGWCFRAGFTEMQILAIKDTTPLEQRKTQWIDGMSLESFLDLEDYSKTIEGYPAPKRAYFSLKRTKNG
ncbi:tRNA 5-methoxyuridine(34)/uridine 5-oxyacetic acid(34) synthase CmoB [Helicobacter sp. 13S00482-2]|uniref:tRNA 5-methoxyuridine(34)/uridine 5-oxyacetic acid(34) synthase CmoB n=1 Tax=Helicobacter sp. 13S00482-2 TaxID=1476200 RepID=UPI000BA5C7E3|nr:tRNA 5-methoxyuridine(34)/uridine 5-oxyacetic acid(34) synthase CmoB [Helicobacter sp. 13S00482-2]PAF54535.1 tRNA 5-methoxyuridine(34)/uridine 5-oxyacetic acid(34) synthase CmoB [Helicobacter sp. 13S00482-2]